MSNNPELMKALEAQYGVDKVQNISYDSVDAYKQSINSAKDEGYVSRWFDNALKAIEDMQAYNTENADKYNQRYGGDAAARIKETLATSGYVADYLKSHYQGSDYTQWDQALQQYRSALQSLDNNNSAARKYYAQFQDENDYNWTRKYDGQSVDQMRSAADALEDGDEKAWLTSRADRTDFSNKMNYNVSAGQQELQQLQQKRADMSDLQKRLQEYQNNPILQLVDHGNFKQMLSAWDEFHKQGGFATLDKEIASKGKSNVEAKELQDSVKQLQEHEQWLTTVRSPDAVSRELEAAKRRAQEMEEQISLDKDSLRTASGGIAVDRIPALQQDQAVYQQTLQQISDLEKELWWGQMQQYEKLQENADFAEKSQYVPHQFDTMNALAGGTGFEDIEYDYINRNPAALGRQTMLDNQSATLLLGRDKSTLQELSDQEIGIYNYLYATQGKDAAKGFLDFLQSDLNARQRQAYEQFAKESAASGTAGKAAASIGSLLLAPMKGAAYVGQAADYLADGKIDQNAGYNRFAYTGTALRNAVAQEIESNPKWGAAGAFGYQLGMSMADFLIAAGLGGGNGDVAGAIMGTGAAADAVIEAKDRGLSDGQAFTLGTVAGLAEALTERYSLENLLDADLLKDSALRYIKKNMLAEGSEEASSSIINLMADIIVSRDKSQWKQSIQQYQTMGYTKAEAFGKALADQAAAIGLDTLGGMISGGILGGGQAVRFGVQSSNTGKAMQAMGMNDDVTQQHITAGLAAAPTSTQYQVAKQMQDKQQQGKQLTAEDRGRLAQSNPAMANETIRKNMGSVSLATPQVNVSNADARWQQAQRLSALTGRDIVFYNGSPSEEGYFQNGKIHINANAVAQEAFVPVFAHELTHSAEMADVYEDLQRVAFQKLRNLGEDITQMRKIKMEQYETEGHPLASEKEADQEIVAEFVRNYLLTDELTIQEVVLDNPSLGRRILNWIDGLLAKMGNENAQERVFLNNARKIYSEALRQTRTSQRSARSSVPESGTTQQAETAEDAETAAALEEVRKAYEAGELDEATYNVIVDTMQQEAQRRKEAGGKKYSFAGSKARTANLEALRQAKALDQEGVANETIRQQTGWFKGADGKWRFEIDDSAMQYHRSGDARFSQMHKDYARHQELEGRLLSGDISNQELDELQSLNEIWGRERRRLNQRVTSGSATLQDIIEHDALFEAYPDLRDVKVRFDAMPRNEMGFYSPVNNLIVLNADLRNAPQETLLHEIQHAIQKAEGFASGSSVSYWDQRLTAGDTPKTAGLASAEERINSFENDPANAEVMEMISALQEAEMGGDEAAYEALQEEAIQKGFMDRVREYDALESAYYAQESRNFWMMPSELYENTAGEIEARNVSERRSMSPEDRKKSPPNLGDDRTVFAENAYSLSASEKMTIEEAQKAYAASSLAEDSNVYSYEFLSRLPDIQPVTVAEVNDIRDASGKVDSAQVVSMGKENALSVGTERAGEIYVKNRYTGRELAVTTASIRHGLNGTMNRLLTNARLGSVIGELVQNAVPINALHNAADIAKGTYAMAGYAVDTSGREFVAIITVEQRSGKVEGVDVFDVTHAVSGRQKRRSERVDTKSQGINLSTNASKISIAEFLSIVKETHQSVLSQDVLDHFGETRNAGGYYTGRAKFSISGSDSAQQVSESASSYKARDNLNNKATEYLTRIENRFVRRIGNQLGIPRYAQWDIVRPAIQSMADEFLQTGSISDETLQSAFATAYDEGKMIDREFYDQYKDVKDHLRGTAVTLSQQDRSDIPDFNLWRKSMFGTLRIVNEGGLPVDSAYRELQEMAPELFPYDITHPADQLLRMGEIAQQIRKVEKSLDEYYGPEAAEFRKWAQHDFGAAVGDIMPELRAVKRYAEQERIEEAKYPRLENEEQAQEAFRNRKQAQRAKDTARAKNLLSDQDERIIKQLLEGVTTLEDLKGKENELNLKGIQEVYEAVHDYEMIDRQIRRYQAEVRQKRQNDVDKFLGSILYWKDKKNGFSLSRETMRRNILDIVTNRSDAMGLLRHIFEPIQIAEAARQRFLNKYRSRVRELNISTTPAKGDEVSEAFAVQLYGEAITSIEMIQNSKGHLKERDGRTEEQWKGLIDDMFQRSPHLDKAKIENAVKTFRQIYDEFFREMNQVLVRNGYPPVEYRKGYFPHFQGQDDGVASRFGKLLGVNFMNDVLPTTINGLTHTFRPGKQWFANAQERTGFRTTYDAIEGFDKYIEGVSNVIYHTDNIQNLRALSRQIRYRASNEGIREEARRIQENADLSDYEKEKRLEDLYATGKYALSNFVTELDEYTNILAGKKSVSDRGVERFLGRKYYTWIKYLESQVGANMVGGNLTSALTNFIPLTQAWGQLDTVNLLSGMRDTLMSWNKSDDFIDRSDFLTSRKGSDKLTQTWVQTAAAKAGLPMEWVDSFTSEAITRGAYYQNLKRGMSEAEALHQADIFAAGVIGDRSKGAMPTIFEMKNPLVKVLTQFQLEVNNQMSEVFKDLPRAARERSSREIVAMLLKYFVGAWLFNELYELLTGRRPALDPIDMGWEAIEAWQKEGFMEAGQALASSVTENLPFVSGLMGGGRVPISSAIPDVGNVWQALTEDPYTVDEETGKASGISMKKRMSMLSTELAKPAMLLAFPFAGNQVMKAWKGIKTVLEGGSYTINNAGQRELQYAVRADDPFQLLGKALMASVMGKSALPEAREWTAGGFKSFDEAQSAVYQDLLDADVDTKDAFDIIDALRSATKTEDMARSEVQRQLLDNSDISDEGKAIAYYGLLAGDKERELMDALTNLGASADVAGNISRELYWIKKLPATEQKASEAKALRESLLTEEEKREVVATLMDSTDLLTEAGNPTEYSKFLTATEGGLSVDTYMDMRAKGVETDDYFDYVDAGLFSDQAANIVLKNKALKPLAGSSKVSYLQRAQIVLDADLTEQQKLDALSAVDGMYESTYEKIRLGYQMGMDLQSYIDLRKAMPNYDANSNGSYTAKETRAAIDGTLPHLSKQEKAVLWQLQNKSWKPKSNPYDRAVGQRVYDAMQAMTDEEAQIATDDPYALMKALSIIS